MSNFASELQEGEKFLSSEQGGQQGGQQQGGQQGGSGGAQQSSGAGQQGGSSSEDNFANKAIDTALSGEGVPTAMDGEINKEVDAEIGKFT